MRVLSKHNGRGRREMGKWEKKRNKDPKIISWLSVEKEGDCNTLKSNIVGHREILVVCDDN